MQLEWVLGTLTLIASSTGVIDIVDKCRTLPTKALRSIDMLTAGFADERLLLLLGFGLYDVDRGRASKLVNRQSSIAEAGCRDWGSFQASASDPDVTHNDWTMGLIVHHAGLGDTPAFSIEFQYADADFAVAHLLTTIYSTYVEQENSSQQPIPPNGLHSTEIARLRGYCGS